MIPVEWTRKKTLDSNRTDRQTPCELRNYYSRCPFILGYFG